MNLLGFQLFFEMKFKMLLTFQNFFPDSFC